MENKSNSASQLEALIHALPYVIWFKDAEGRFDKINRLFLDQVEKAEKDVKGRYEREVLNEEDAALSEEGDREIMKNGQTSQETYSRNQRIFKTIRFPVLNEKGTITGTGGYREDITNLTQSLQELHMEKEYLETTMTG